MGIYRKATDYQNKLSASALKQRAAPHRKKLLTILVSLLAIVVAAYVVYRIINRPTSNKQQTEAALANATKSQNTDTTIANLQKTYDDAASAEGKAQAAYYLAAHYTVKDDHKNALKFYREAEKFYKSGNIDVVLGVASEAEALTDNKLAKEYYQKAIDYYKPQVESNPTLQELVSKYEAKLKDLQ